jgi:hypothetical protein
MLTYAWMGLGFVVSAVIVFLTVKEIIRAVKASKRGEKSDYDFDID